MTTKLPERLTFYFDGEGRLGSDAEFWRDWVSSKRSMCSWDLEMGEYRPGLRVTPPFLRSQKGESVRANLAVEKESFENVVSLVDHLVEAARQRGTAIRLLLNGRTAGAATPSGVDEALAGLLEGWRAAIADHPGDAPSQPEREGVVSVWTGSFASRAEFDAFFRERYGTDGPISPFARALGVTFYDHYGLEALFFDKPTSLRTAVGTLSFSASFASRLLDKTASAATTCTALVALFDFDYSVVEAKANDPLRDGTRIELIGVVEYKAP